MVQGNWFRVDSRGNAICPGKDVACFVMPGDKTSFQPNDAQGLVATNPNEDGAQDSNGQYPAPANQADLLDPSNKDSSLTPALQPDEQSDLNAVASGQSDAEDQTLNLDS